ncbi:hypothetical protein K458DRAFT_412469 [Lentithecium fluviatile CBS 122367]|uniref:Uncharacterized protein n=1 Tax=Lentithecium fluviatile CBS 122367 TaxID=1168545 RepID=A0A6G1JKS6_9PLEO|nr:hypothetical protein K458DRAFT_412469 [Lentithecium fluviatile CBS 122367]
MDPFRNFALHNSKVQALLHEQHSQRPQHQDSTTSGSEMPPPPAYHMVVDPTAPIPNLHNPYDADDEEKDDDDTPEINVNAMTQIRGHGNIISIAQMDSVRIANLIVALLHGQVSPLVPPPPAAATSEPHAPAPPQPEASRTHADAPPRHRSRRGPQHHIPKVNVTVNCGATVIGDRNIVGPGLGDIARHMQIAQRNQMAARMAAQQQAQQAQQQQSQMGANRSPGMQTSGLGFSVGGHPPHIATPPMSRSSSFGSQGSSSGLKRKVEESIEENDAKRTC